MILVRQNLKALLLSDHRAGVVHRDVKPDNLLLGHPKRGVGANRALHLVDFGLAALGPAFVDETSVKAEEAFAQSESDSDIYADAFIKKEKTKVVVSGTPAFSAAAAPCCGMRASAVLAAFATSASALSRIASKNASTLSKTWPSGSGTAWFVGILRGST